MNTRTMKKRIISKQKNRKIGFEMMGSQRKTVRKNKRKSIKFGGSELTKFNFTLPNTEYYSKQENKTTKMGYGIWSLEPLARPDVIKIKCQDDHNQVYLNKSIPYGEYTNKSVYVLWVRHCYSCSNQANPMTDFRNFRNKFLREPLCSGNDSLKRAIQLGFFLKSKNPNTQFEFFSSCLPRAMETAKAISFGMREAEQTPDSSSTKIKILENISESLNLIDMVAMPGYIGTQNATTDTKSQEYMSFLNENLNGFDIEKSSQFRTPICSSSGDLQDDYKEFLLRNILDESSELINSEQVVNIIVSHGGYIRQNVIEPFQVMMNGKSKISHPDNVEPKLVKYTYDTNSKEIVINSEEKVTDEDILLEDERISNFYKESLLSKQLKDDQCSISYTQSIKNQS